MLDSHQRFFRGGLPVFLRLKTVDDADTPFTELGFQFAATGAQNNITDYQIYPQPTVDEVSLHNIGLNQARLSFGARRFMVSHSFVQTQMQKRGITDPLRVWTDPLVVGLYYDNRLFSIESVTHEDAAGEIIDWLIIANASDRFVAPEAQG